MDRPLFYFHDFATHRVLAILNWIVRVYFDITSVCSFISWNRCTNYTVVLTLIEDINGLLTLTDFSWPRMELKRFVSLHLSSQCSRILSLTPLDITNAMIPKSMGSVNQQYLWCLKAVASWVQYRGYDE